MTESVETTKRDSPFVALLAVFWTAMGFSAFGEGRMWLGAAAVALGLLTGASYLWPQSALARFLRAPVWQRKRPTGG